MELKKNFQDLKKNSFKVLISGLTVFGVGIFIFPMSAEAAKFNFSYERNNGKIFQGILEGTRDGDNVIVNSIFSTFYDDNPTLGIDEIFSFDSKTRSEVGASPGMFIFPTVSFSGNFMDIVACTFQCGNPNLGDLAPGFLFNTTDILNSLQDVSNPDSGKPGSETTTAQSGGFSIPTPLYSSTDTSFGGTVIEQFDPTKWSLTPIPEPDTLLGLGTLVLLGFTTRRRKQKGKSTLV